MTERAVDKFILEMGLIAKADGLPPIAGQIIGYLVVEGGTRSLSDMTEALKISKASASTNARLLEDKGALQKVARLGQRDDAYALVDGANIQMLHTLSRRFKRNADSIAALAVNFPDSHAEARDRVQKVSKTYRQSAEFLDHWAADLAKSQDMEPQQTRHERPNE